MVKLLRSKSLVVLLILVFFVSCFSLLLVVDGQVVGSGSIDSGLVGYWRLDENSGVSVSDSSGDGLSGVVHVSDWVTGRYGSALHFGGNSSSYLDLGASSLYQFSHGAGFSMFVWVKGLDSEQDYTQNGYGLGLPNNFVFVPIDRNAGNSTERMRWYIGLNVNGSVATFPSLDGINILNGSWHLVGCTYDGSVFNLYQDGVVLRTWSYVGYKDQTGTNHLILGSLWAGSNYFKGSLDGFRLYNRSLSVSEVAYLYNGFYVSVTHDAGSTITPDDFVNVGVDQSQSFTVGALGGYSSWTQYIDGVAYAPQAVVTLSGVQANRTLYVTSQWIGGVSSAPTSIVVVSGDTSYMDFVFVFGLMGFLLVINFFCMMYFNGVYGSVLAFIIGLFTFVIGMDFVLVGGYNTYINAFLLLVIVISGFEMLFVSLRLRAFRSRR